MRHAKGLAPVIHHHAGQAIRVADGDGQAHLASVGSIHAAQAGQIVAHPRASVRRAGLDQFTTMHLLQTGHGIGLYAPRCEQKIPIFYGQSPVIAHMQAKIKAEIGLWAESTLPGAGESLESIPRDADKRHGSRLIHSPASLM
jgi:hypothetical protein